MKLNFSPMRGIIRHGHSTTNDIIIIVSDTQFGHRDRVHRRNFENLKSEDGGGRHLEKKIEKSPYIPHNGLTYRNEIWHGDTILA